MTVGTQMQQTIANCESVLASLKGFALETQDQNAKQMFQNMTTQQQTVLDNLNARLQYIQSEEPQFKQQ
ncbi:DUF1657 domain-containing protein [Virgibacillus alimentarius]|uniref:DUF1657 domain-containing protein n=1 Tax=Virgibacillus alimentarius TaxID=698769 RepID=A0ABS4S4A8_9BACI|nr:MULTISPECIES: DUF1657 domain-containing protein [Virgibacillus]MBP2256316.1 hypothetical protein [Virgibacillus alimentarius]HLR66262.1 DUF1657 domain-containing protein [Virgibacillus sp.]